jgi:hypothetical protein
MQRQSHFFGRKVPQCDLKSFVKRQRESPLIAASRATDAMDQPDRFLPHDCRPCFVFEHGFDLGLIRQGMKERLNKAEPNVSRFADQFESGHVDVICTDLTVTDYSVAGELKSGYTKSG